MLSLACKQQLLRKFPDVKLSYDCLLHRKVSADLYFLIPKGPKAFLWITYYKRKCIALVLTLDAKGSIRKIEPVVLAFASKLALGTILYGTIFESNSSTCFCFEDFHWLEGRNIEDNTMSAKLEALGGLFSSLQRSRHAQITIGAPVITTDYKEII